MTTTPPAPSPATSTNHPAPVTPAPSHYNSAYIQIETFVFNPALVTGFLHRSATTDESVAVTEVLYGSHHLTVEDKQQHLFHHLCRHVSPEKPKTTV
jgi:hypothetical protein